MTRSQQYRDGQREAEKWAVRWLHRRADLMIDPKAKAILHTAATNLGWDARERDADRAMKGDYE